MSTLRITVVSDTTPPTVPTGLTATAISESQINLTWGASTDTGGSGVKSYNVYADGVLTATISTLSYSDTQLAPYSSHGYQVSAVDVVSNESARSAVVNARTLDVTAPGVPSGLTATPFSETQIDLTWTAATDVGSGVTGYKIYRDNALITQVSGTSYSDHGVLSYTQHTYAVSALDVANNESARSTAVTVRSLDATAPSVPAALTATAISSSQINLAWSAATDTGSGVANYKIYRNAVATPVATVGAGTTTYQDGSLAASTAYSYRVSALDVSGNESAQSTAASATTQAASGAALGPQQLWRGYVTSSWAFILIWPPADGTMPAGYNVYRVGNSAPLNGSTPIVPVYGGIGSDAAPSIKTAYWRDFGADLTGGKLAPNTTYNYYAKGVTGGVETQASPTLTITTKAGNATPTTAPTSPTDPAAFMPPYQLPTGTRWTATKNALTDNTGSAGAGTGAQSNVGCSLSYALAHAAPNDVIVLTAPLTYMSGTAFDGAYAFGISAGDATSWIYIVTDQDPGYNPAGTLPPYSYETERRYTQASTAGGVAAGATSLVMSTVFQARTGWYTLVFQSACPSGIESRQALLMNGANTAQWNVGLQAACGANFLIGIGNQVTPWDAGVTIREGVNVGNLSPSMPTIQYPKTGGISGGFEFGATAQNIRMVGINIQVEDSFTGPGSRGACVTTARGSSGIFLDRCVLGRDNTASIRSYFTRAILSNADGIGVHQCYLYGADSGPGGSDSQGFAHVGGGPVCIENSYIEALSENYIAGGSRVDSNRVPHDLTLRYNWSHKPTTWQLTTTLPLAGPVSPPVQQSISRRVKNHYELKCCYRFAYYGNVIQNNGYCQASAGQQARACPATPRDQVSSTAAQKVSGTWASGTATMKAFFGLPFDAGTGAGKKFTTTITSTDHPGYNGTFICTALDDDYFTYALPTDPGGAASANTTTYILPPQCGGPWQNIIDGDVHDNQVYGCGQFFYFLTGTDYNPAVYSERIRVYNNMCWINPAFTDDTFGLTPNTSSGCVGVRGTDFGGWPCVDCEFSNNTLIIIPQNYGYSLPGVAQVIVGISNIGTTPNSLQDRFVFINNIIDADPGGTIESPGTPAPPNTNAKGGTWRANSFDANGRWTNNLFIKDASSGGNAFTAAPNVTYNPIDYPAIGMKNFVSNITMPTAPTDYNVVGGTYATAATDGGPLGARMAARVLGNSMQGMTLTAFSPYTGGQWLKFVGFDALYRNTLPLYPASPWGGTANWTDALQQIWNAAGDITEAFAADNTVPQNVSSTVLVSTMVNAYNSSAATQDTYQVQPDTSVAQGMVYMSRWLWLQADIISRGPFTFLELTEFKTADPTERMQIGVVMASYTGFGATTPVFRMAHDEWNGSTWLTYMGTFMSPTGVNTGNYGIGQTYKAPVPLGRWFKLEFAFNRNDTTNQGWMWAALTDPGSTDAVLKAGTQIFAARGAFNFTDNGPVTRTLGLNMSQTSKRINRLYLHAVYSDLTRNAASPYVIKMTDMQLYTGWPTSASAHPANYF